jgi:hypothetical protein
MNCEGRLVHGAIQKASDWVYLTNDTDEGHHFVPY